MANRPGSHHWSKNGKLPWLYPCISVYAENISQIIFLYTALSLLQNGKLPRLFSPELIEEVFTKESGQNFVTDLRKGLDALGVYTVCINLFLKYYKSAQLAQKACELMSWCSVHCLSICISVYMLYYKCRGLSPGVGLTTRVDLLTSLLKRYYIHVHMYIESSKIRGISFCGENVIIKKW